MYTHVHSTEPENLLVSLSFWLSLHFDPRGVLCAPEQIRLSTESEKLAWRSVVGALLPERSRGLAGRGYLDVRRDAPAEEEMEQTEWPELKVYFTSVTDQWATVAVAGPNARAVLTAVGTDIDLEAEAFPFMSWREGQVGGMPARVFRVSFSG